METPAIEPGPSLDAIKTQVEIEKMHAEIGKIMAETIKINRENRFLPLTYGAALFGAAVAFVKLFLH
jgi:hypothetical protein